MAVSVFFGTTEVTSGITVTNDTTLTVTTPAHAAGKVDVKVKTSGGTSTALTDGFEFTPTPPKPTVTDAAPGTGDAAGGTSVTITGTGFKEGAA